MDTVGFVSNVPTNLIQCFVATLEDAMLADVIIHVEDLSSPDLIHQRNHVVETLKTLAVGNKCDLVNTASENSLPVSATKRYGIDTLRDKIEEMVLKVTDRKIMTVKVPSGKDEMKYDIYFDLRI
ncbi:hypothetical protein FQR65_LT06924 [Abscondita terminalis]|nr:hypothetical protein FQR65_LT06924 [Abscondita terminalis]